MTFPSWVSFLSCQTTRQPKPCDVSRGYAGQGGWHPPTPLVWRGMIPYKQHSVKLCHCSLSSTSSWCWSSPKTPLPWEVLPLHNATFTCLCLFGANNPCKGVNEKKIKPDSAVTLCFGIHRYKLFSGTWSLNVSVPGGSWVDALSNWFNRRSLTPSRVLMTVLI